MMRIFYLLGVCFRRRMTTPADATGSFDIAATLTTIDSVVVNGSFDITATYTVA